MQRPDDVVGVKRTQRSDDSVMSATSSVHSHASVKQMRSTTEAPLSTPLRQPARSPVSSSSRSHPYAELGADESVHEIAYGSYFDTLRDTYFVDRCQVDHRRVPLMPVAFADPVPDPVPESAVDVHMSSAHVDKDWLMDDPCPGIVTQHVPVDDSMDISSLSANDSLDRALSIEIDLMKASPFF